MRHAIGRVPGVLGCVAAAWTLAVPTAGAQAPGSAPWYRTLDDRMSVRRPASLGEWQERAAWLREHVLATAGLLPEPERTPLDPVVFDERDHGDYRVSKVYFESLPGFFVAGNLYKPAGPGPFPAILSPHGHWTHGRLEHTDTASVPGRAIGFARLGFVVFTYDMIGYNDSRQLPHRSSSGESARPWGRREGLWGLSLAGLQLWNGIRALDFLESLPEVARERIGATGASGGGTQVFLLSAVDERVAASAPVNMISLRMQGGCLCENLPHLRLETNNVEVAALAAPRPLLMVAATGDWTSETKEIEYPEMRRFYELFGKADRVSAIRVDAGHNYNRESREAVFAWMMRWLKDAPATLSLSEQPFQVDPEPDLLVFHDRPLPEGALTAEALAESWIAAARRQLGAADRRPFRSALLHALGFPRQEPPPPPSAGGRRLVVLASTDPQVEPALERAGFAVRTVAFTPFDAAAAATVRHFETYNRGPASQRVADLVRALVNAPGAALVADGEAAPPAFLAAAVAAVPVAVLDMDAFDVSSDAAFLARLDVPGLRRAGDLDTAAAMARGTLVVHNAGARFPVDGVTAHARKLTADEVVRLLQAD